VNVADAGFPEVEDASQLLAKLRATYQQAGGSIPLARGRKIGRKGDKSS